MYIWWNANTYELIIPRMEIWWNTPDNISVTGTQLLWLWMEYWHQICAALHLPPLDCIVANNFKHKLTYLTSSKHTTTTHCCVAEVGTNWRCLPGITSQNFSGSHVRISRDHKSEFPEITSQNFPGVSAALWPAPVKHLIPRPMSYIAIRATTTNAGLELGGFTP